MRLGNIENVMTNAFLQYTDGPFPQRFRLHCNDAVRVQRVRDPTFATALFFAASTCFTSEHYIRFQCQQRETQHAGMVQQIFRHPRSHILNYRQAPWRALSNLMQTTDNHWRNSSSSMSWRLTPTRMTQC